jgi:hypothetical protein
VTVAGHLRCPNMRKKAGELVVISSYSVVMQTNILVPGAPRDGEYEVTSGVGVEPTFKYGPVWSS